MIVFKGNPKKLKELIYKDGKLYYEETYYKRYDLNELFDSANECKDVILFSEEFKENFNSFIKIIKKLHGEKGIYLEHINNVFVINEIENIDEAMKKFTHNFFTMLKPRYDNNGGYLKGQVIYFTFTHNNKTFVLTYIYLTPNIGASGKQLDHNGKNLLNQINGALNKIFPNNYLTTLRHYTTPMVDSPMSLYSEHGFIAIYNEGVEFQRLGLFTPIVEISEEITIKCCTYTSTALDFLL